MDNLWIGLRAELLKTKRTLALLLTLLAPAVIVMLVSVLYLQHATYYTSKGDTNPWSLFSQMTMLYWFAMMLPLFITLETALIAQLEHTRRNWRLIYTTPLPRWAVYAAKQIVVSGWIAISTVVLLVLMLAAGACLQWHNPQYGLNAPVPWMEILRTAGLATLASGFMVTFHLWVSTRWSSFVVATGTGIAAFIISIFIFGDDIAAFIPWSIPGVIVLANETGANVPISLAIGCLAGLLLALPAALDVTRQDIV